MNFEPDYRNILQAAQNKRPPRLPLYEHIIDPEFMEKATGRKFAELLNGEESDIREFFRHFCRFWKDMTYDTVSFEVIITEILPAGGALQAEIPGPIQNRKDFENYPWDEIPRRFWQVAQPRFEILRESMPRGMKAIGGVGNGVFEVSEDLVGLEGLCYMQADDPELFSRLYRRIGDVMVQLWSEFLSRHADTFVLCRMGDDLGYKTSTFFPPPMINACIIPQYRRIIEQVHAAGKPFLLHCCGNIFGVMDSIIKTGIDAKHSNEDQIAPFDKWIEDYNDRIGLFGGIDVDVLCCRSPQQVEEKVFADAARFRQNARGFALGSGNSIPDYVPVDGYMAMIKAAQKLRTGRKI